MYLPWMQLCNKWKDQKHVPLWQHVCRHTWVCKITSVVLVQCVRLLRKGQNPTLGLERASRSSQALWLPLQLVLAKVTPCSWCPQHHVGVWIMRGLAVLLLLAGHVWSLLPPWETSPFLPLWKDKWYILKYCFVRSEHNFVSESVWVIEIVG